MKRLPHALKTQSTSATVVERENQHVHKENRDRSHREKNIIQDKILIKLNQIETWIIDDLMIDKTAINYQKIQVRYAKIVHFKKLLDMDNYFSCNESMEN
jgi:hypothetical protein